jgi:DNA-binding NtrC family response regulator
VSPIETRIVLFDPRVDDLDAWPEGVRAGDRRVHVCREASDALRLLLASTDRAVLVARFSSTSPFEGLLLMHAARYRDPPASILVITGDPEAARAVLAAQGVVAEVLRPPATIDELLVRLGA